MSHDANETETYGDYSVDDEDQLQPEDTLDEGGDPLDDGNTPPDESTTLPKISPVCRAWCAPM